MAKMVPSQYNPETTSYGEQQIFRAMGQLPDTYTVFHSLALNSHESKLFAEIDFVVLGPQGVLCLEVKGGSIKCHERQWYSYGQEGSRPIQNPFTQAQTAAMALRDDIKDYFRNNRNIVGACFASGVAFPDIAFCERGPEIRPEIVYDKNSGDLMAYIERVFEYWKDEFRRRYDYELTGLSGIARTQLERYLCNDFDIVYTVGARVDQVKQETIRLTESQMRVLNYVALNPRILMTGGAGTGKTILSLEHARRLARQGQQVLFLCYNHNLTFHLQHRIRVQDPEVADTRLQVDAIYKYLLRTLEAGQHLPPRPPQSDGQAYSKYWLHDIPQAFLELAGADLQPRHDVLVIDEGQDLLNPLLLQCLDKLVEGGLGQGRWLIALDPRQNLYQTQLADGLEQLNRLNPATLTLEDNYRNAPEIIEYTIENTGIDPQVNALIQSPGLKIREDFYQDLREQRIKLVKALEQLKKDEVPPADICIVSLTSYEKSVLQGHPQAGKFPIQHLTDLPPEEWDSDKVKFSSVHRFKGLESPVVILTDVTSTQGEYATRCYTAMTRAKALLWVLKQEGPDR
jgi:hypothetical protein